MAWVVTDHGSANNSSGATLAKAVSANVLAGSVIVVAVYDKSVAASGGSMTDDAGNTYTAVSPTNPGASTSNGICQFFYSILGSQLNSGQNVTYTKQTSGSVCSISVLSATGGASSSILDTAVTAANTTNTNVSSPTSLTSGTPAVSGELFIAMSGEVQNNTTLSTDSGNGWAVPPAINNTGAACQVGGNQVNAGTGTKAWQPSSNKSGNWASIIIGLKPLVALTKSWFEQTEILPQFRRDVSTTSFIPLPAYVAPPAIPRGPSSLEIGYAARRWLEPQSSPIVRSIPSRVFDRSQYAAPPRRAGIDAPGFVPRAPAIITRPSQQEALYRVVRGLVDAGFIPGPKAFFKKPTGDDSALLRSPHFEVFAPSFVPPIRPAILDVFVKDWRKKRRRGRDPIELEIEEKAKRRAALELAIYGPEAAEIAARAPEMPVIHTPPNVEELAKIIAAAQRELAQSQHLQALSDDENDLEAILRDIL